MDDARLVEPLTIKMHERDNVAIVANDGGLPAGTALAGGLTLVDKVPQGHKVALADLAAGDPVLRYNVVIGRAAKPIAAGSWVHERLLEMPAARSLEGLPIATVKPPLLEPLDGYTFEGYRNADGTVGTRNILAITQTVQCVAGVTEFAVTSHQGRAAAQVPERRRRGRARAQLRLRRGDRRAGRRGADPHAAQHHAQPEFRQRDHGGQPRLREAAARAAAAAGQLPDRRRAQRRGRRRLRRGPARRRVPAGRRARRLHVDDRLDHDHGRGTPRAPQRAPPRDRARERTGRRRAVRRQRRLQRRDRESRGRLLHRPAGARRRDRDVLRDDRSARRHRSTDVARRRTPRSPPR